MNKINIILITATVIILLGLIYFIYPFGGTTVTIEGTFHGDTISPFDYWYWTIKRAQSGGNTATIASIGDTGYVTIKGYMYPDPDYYPDYANEIHEATCDTGRKINTIIGEDVNFILKWKNVDVHKEEYPDGMWFEFYFEAYEASSCIPFTDFCFSLSPLCARSESISFWVV